MKRMEDLSSSNLTLDEVDEVIQDKSMWKSFNDIVDRVGKDLPVSKREMDSCTIMVTAMLTFRSWQRPGAVANATMTEYRNSQEIVQDCNSTEGCWPQDWSVRSAKLVIPPEDLSKLHSYVTVVRPFMQLPLSANTLWGQKMCSRHGWYGCFISYTYTGLHLEIDPRGDEMSISLIASTNIVISWKRKEGVLLELHALTLAACSYVLLMYTLA